MFRVVGLWLGNFIINVLDDEIESVCFRVIYSFYYGFWEIRGRM